MKTQRQHNIPAALPIPLSMFQDAHLRDNETMPLAAFKLRKHADYQRVYKASRKHFSQSMSYFFRLRAEEELLPEGPRVGLTAGRVLGKAVERNRIKRRLREAVRANLDRLPLSIDVVLHPRKSVAEMEYSRLTSEIAVIFSKIQTQTEKGRSAAATQPKGTAQ